MALYILDSEDLHRKSKPLVQTLLTYKRPRNFYTLLSHEQNPTDKEIKIQ